MFYSEEHGSYTGLCDITANNTGEEGRAQLASYTIESIQHLPSHYVRSIPTGSYANNKDFRYEGERVVNIRKEKHKRKTNLVQRGFVP